MKTYRVHLTEMICGDIIVEVENLTEAEVKALHSTEIDWDSDSEVEVTNVVELDASGNEK